VAGGDALVTTLPVRRYDPETSHQAAREITASGLRATQARKVLAAVAAHPGRTSAELAELAGLSRYTTARRLPELEAHGLVRRGPARRSVTSDPATDGALGLTWWAVTVQTELRLR
jgi:CRP-like cAMP-binding protein